MQDSPALMEEKIMMRHKFYWICAVFFCVIFGGTTGFTQSASAPQEEAAIQASKDENGALFLNFKGATLINVLDSLSELSQINFVAGSEIAQREVNMNLGGVTLEQALQALSTGSNVTYDYIAESNIILFRASSDAPQLAPLVTRVFKLYYMRASKVLEVNTASYTTGGGGASSAGTGSSSGGSAGGGGGLQSLGSAVQEDVANSQNVPIVKIMEKMLSERGTVAVDIRSNSLIVTDSEDRLNRIAAVVAELDRPLNQVLINVLLVETFEDLDRELGVQWAQGTGADDGLFGTVTGGTRATKFPYNMSDNLFGLGGGADSVFSSDTDTAVADALATTGTQSFSTLNVKVKALQNASKLHILAKPNVLVLDNHPAIIKISTLAAIGEQTVTTAAGSSDTSTSSESAERAEVGTILRVTPQINSQDQITMNIEPVFATIDQSTIDIGAGETGDPTMRAARTTVMVTSGKTLVMGGLLFSTHSDGDRKVPFLGDIPVLGRLFTNDNKSIQDRELILFLTPEIIKNPAALMPSSMPDKDQKFDDENAQFWKYKKKMWYKDMVNGGPKKPVEFDSYFKVRENTLDQTTAALQAQKDTAMKGEVQTVGKTTSVSDGVKW